MNLSQLEDFEKSDGEFRLTKIESKRPYSMVRVGHVRHGFLTLLKRHDKDVRLMIQNNGFASGLTTSPIVKIVDSTENSIIVETEGGVYKLERL